MPSPTACQIIGHPAVVVVGSQAILGSFGEFVTEHVTEQASSQYTKQERRPRPIDPNAVRLERSADYDITGTWRVMAGPGDAAILVGFVHRNGLSNKWQAQTPAMIAISGGALAHPTGRTGPSRAAPPADRQPIAAKYLIPALIQGCPPHR